jgi:hypothetical protein
MNYSDKPWLSSYSIGVSAKIAFEALCIPEFLERATREFPRNMALVHGI